MPSSKIPDPQEWHVFHARTVVAVGSFALALCLAAPSIAQESDQLPITALAGKGPKDATVKPHTHQNGQAHARFGIPDIESVANFNGHFLADGFDSDRNPQREWYTNTMGNPPQLGGTPGLFGDAFTDVTALSHEIAESFNDPFVASDGVHNVTPWWASDNGQCQNVLEDGDVIEGLPDARSR
jgi:hypothetical protein